MNLRAFTDVMARAREARDGERRCRVCKCTLEHACWHEEFGPCWWIEDDLCSHCGSPEIVACDYDGLDLKNSTDAAALAAWARRARVALQHASSTPASAFEP